MPWSPLVLHEHPRVRSPAPLIKDLSTTNNSVQNNIQLRRRKNQNIHWERVFVYIAEEICAILWSTFWLRCLWKIVQMTNLHIHIKNCILRLTREKKSNLFHFFLTYNMSMHCICDGFSIGQDLGQVLGPQCIPVKGYSLFYLNSILREGPSFPKKGVAGTNYWGKTTSCTTNKW